MTLRDMNAKNIKTRTYSGAGTLRDINFRPVEKIPEESEALPEKQLIPASRYQSMPLPDVRHIQTPQSVYVSPKNENMYNKPAPPVPPHPPEPVKPDPSKFVEERTETPPPKMVRVTVPVRKKVDNVNNEFGAFGSTFDGDTDQSTMIMEIPVMNNVDDYKI